MVENQGQDIIYKREGRARGAQDFSQGGGARFLRIKTFSGIRNKSKVKGSKLKKKDTKLKKKDTKLKKKGTKLKKRYKTQEK